MLSPPLHNHSWSELPTGTNGEVERVGGLHIQSSSAPWASRVPASLQRGVSQDSCLSIVYDKAAGRGAAGLNGVVDSRPLHKRSGLALFALSPSGASSAHHLQALVRQPCLLRGVTWRRVKILVRLSFRRSRPGVALPPQVKWRGNDFADGHTASNTPDLF